MRKGKLIVLALVAIYLLAASLPSTQGEEGKKASSKGSNIRRINPPTLSTPKGYTHTVVVSGGQTVYIAGQVPLDKDGKLVGAGDVDNCQVEETQSRKIVKYNFGDRVRGQCRTGSLTPATGPHIGAHNST